MLQNVIQDLECSLGNNVINISGFQTRRGISRATESMGSVKIYLRLWLQSMSQ